MTIRAPAAVLVALALLAMPDPVPIRGTARAAAQPFAPAQLRDFPRGRLTIERAKGRDTFNVWIADTPERHQQGLMWIRELPADHGMVFVLDEPRPMNMWMKNTYVPLDMLFFGADGRILSIVGNATPLSTRLIESRATVHGVVELLGGEAMRRGIAVADRIRFEALPR
jgi:hypothetical protein